MEELIFSSDQRVIPMARLQRPEHLISDSFTHALLHFGDESTIKKATG